MALGINEQNEFIQNLLGDLAYADFYHDFSDSTMFDKLKTEISKIKKLNKENIDGENIIEYINNKINSRVPNRGEVLRPVNTVYEYFQATDLLTPAIEKLDDNYLKEDKILDTILGNNIYKGIKQILKTNEENYFKGTMALPKDRPLNINIGEIRRNYKVSAYPTKKDEEYYNLPYSYREVSNNSNFIILIDSSFFSFSSLRDEDILLKITNNKGSDFLNVNDINRCYTFYIIQNSENLADSATKISLFNKGNQRIKIKILKDKINTNIKFPAYDDINFTQNINYFSSIELNTEKNKEEIEADANYPTLPKKHYKNISFLGSRNTAALNALIESYKLNYNPFKGENSEDISNKNKKLQALIYLLLKRFGDWSQALSLLDRGRIYEVYDYDTGEKEYDTTLNELKSKEKADIALVTHDRILLAYSILLGLNVFYSLKTKEIKETKETKKRKIEETNDNSTIWNIYFKNNDDVLEVDKSIYIKISPDYHRTIEEYKKKSDEIYENILDTLEKMTLQIPDDIIYDTVLGKLVYKTTFINPLRIKGPDSEGVRKDYEQQNTKSHILFFQDFITKIRKYLTMTANLTSSEIIENELKKLKEMYNKIKSNPERDELYKDLNDIYLNIESLHTVNINLENIYTNEEEENDKNTIAKYFEYIDSDFSKVRDEIINNYIILLNKIENNYIISINILQNNKFDENDKDIFLNIIPHIDQLIYNNVLINKNNKESICRLLKELRNKLTASDTTQDVIENPSESKGKKNPNKECNNIISTARHPESNGEKMEYYKKACDIANKLKSEGKKYDGDIEVPLDPFRGIPFKPYTIMSRRGNPIHIERISYNNEESRNPQEEETQLVSGVNTNSNNNSPPTKKPKMEGGYIIEYIYDEGNFRSTISVEEKNPIKKFILFYLDSLYSRLFSLKQYSNGGDDNDYPSFDENIYEQYLIIYKELISIDLFLETSNLKELKAIYNKKRYQWKRADLKPYMEELNGGLNEVDDKLHKYYEELHQRVSTARVTTPTKAKVTTPNKHVTKNNRKRNSINATQHKTNSKHHTRRKRRTNPINQTRRNNRRVV